MHRYAAVVKAGDYIIHTNNVNSTFFRCFIGNSQASRRACINWFVFLARPPVSGIRFIESLPENSPMDNAGYLNRRCPMMG